MDDPGLGGGNEAGGRSGRPGPHGDPEAVAGVGVLALRWTGRADQGPGRTTPADLCRDRAEAFRGALEGGPRAGVVVGAVGGTAHVRLLGLGCVADRPGTPRRAVVGVRDRRARPGPRPQPAGADRDAHDGTEHGPVLLDALRAVVRLHDPGHVLPLEAHRRPRAETVAATRAPRGRAARRRDLHRRDDRSVYASRPQARRLPRTGISAKCSAGGVVASAGAVANGDPVSMAGACVRGDHAHRVDGSRYPGALGAVSRSRGRRQRLRPGDDQACESPPGADRSPERRPHTSGKLPRQHRTERPAGAAPCRRRRSAVLAGHLASGQGEVPAVAAPAGHRHRPDRSVPFAAVASQQVLAR